MIGNERLVVGVLVVGVLVAGVMATMGTGAAVAAPPSQAPVAGQGHISPQPPGPASSQPQGRFILVIDPGHPSEVSAGAKANGLREVDINWEIGQALAAHLAGRSDLLVLVNRQEKMKMMTNRERAEFANRVGAHLTLRLHCDHAPGQSGFVIYYPDTQGTHAGKTGPSAAVIAGSRQAALAVHRGMARRLAGLLPDGGIKTDRSTTVGARHGGALIGSIWSEVPTITVEMLYLNNPRDAAFIRTAAGRQAMVEALAAGVLEAQNDLAGRPAR
ncbi:MAG: N-acetylmuramoyl-L-alanine amidase [Candidatus Ozemobacter sibiricus]|uniref:N-acetylmuramoyl-L-alanine amidase n=1 Tax=Candidatus Ozemobacter sibiricus TaxID=2268124 RepID=A0A367ZR85_9BACT|nr:MAG: N-acetylmuramoyl-L-alanine amidase [Candidatus Ozemobacter sibiricus]